jgi:hypothetical protein
LRRHGISCCDLQPLGVLVEHGIDDVDKGLVAVEKPVPTGEQIALQPALALVLAQHLHHPPVGRQVVVGRGVGLPLARSVTSRQVLPAFERFSSGLNTRKFFCSSVQLHDIAQEWPIHGCRRCIGPPGAGTSTA